MLVLFYKACLAGKNISALDDNPKSILRLWEDQVVMKEI